MLKSTVVPVFDGHNDTILHLAIKKPGTEQDFLTGREGHIDLPKARAGGLAGVAVLRIIAALAVPIISFVVLWLTFEFLRNAEANRLVLAVVAIVVGVLGVFALYWGMDLVVNLLPNRFQESVRPFVFVGPALVILTVFLVYPAVNTTVISFMDAQSREFTGLDNYMFEGCTFDRDVPDIPALRMDVRDVEVEHLRGFDAVMEDVIKEANDGPKYIFVSFDIDTLDPAFVPGTGTPEPGGLLPREAFPILRRLCAESNVVGFELVELNPLVDPTYVSAMNANRIVRECLTGMAMRKMGLTDKHYLSPNTVDDGRK